MTPATMPDARLKLLYEMAADRYLRSLPLEHHMEALAQATQRTITLQSFGVIRAARPDVYCFNEMLVQYPLGDTAGIGQVVPDNMIAVSPAPLDLDGSFNLPLQPVGPLLVLEYVSKSSRRKDYDENMRKYESIRVPYYLLFYPDNDELSLFRLSGGTFVSVRPDAAGRLKVPELELEVALVDGWVRFWFRGGFVPLPDELVQRMNALRDQVTAANQAQARAEQAQARAEQVAETERRERAKAEQVAETERRERAKAEQAAETERRERAKAEQVAEADRRERAKAEQAAEADRRERAKAEQAAEADRRERLAAEAEIARLRDELARARGHAP